MLMTRQKSYMLACKLLQILEPPVNTVQVADSTPSNISNILALA